jgi:hypothetical protein
MFVGESVVDDSKVILCETMQAMQVTFFRHRYRSNCGFVWREAALSRQAAHWHSKKLSTKVDSNIVKEHTMLTSIKVTV